MINYKQREVGFLKKKVLTAVLAAQLILQTAVSANTIQSIAVTKDNKIVVTGSLETKDEMLVNLYIRNAESGTNINDGLVAADSIASGKDGGYTFTVDLENSLETGGKFTAHTVSQRESTDTYTFDFYKNSEIESIVEEIDGVSGDIEKIAEIIKREKDKLAYKNSDMIAPIAESYPLDIAYIISESEITADNILKKIEAACVIKKIETCQNAETINELITQYGELPDAAQTAEYTNLSDEEKELIGKMFIMQTNAYKSTAEFQDDLKKCSVLCELYYANGTSALLGIVKKHDTIFDLTKFNKQGDNQTSILKKLASAIENNNVKTVSDVQSILDSGTSSGGGSSGGSSGGGSSSSSGGGSSVMMPSNGGGIYTGNTVETQKINFKDLKDYEWAKKSIERLAELKIINGYSTEEFAPQDNVSRAQLCKMICGVFGIGASAAEMPFADVDSGAWYMPYVSALYQRGIVNGTGENTFSPDSSVTRQDMCVMICRAIENAGISLSVTEEELVFADAEKIAEYAEKAIKMLYEQELVRGMEDGSFAPENCASRAECAVLLNSLYDWLDRQK